MKLLLHSPKDQILHWVFKVNLQKILVLCTSCFDGWVLFSSSVIKWYFTVLGFLSDFPTKDKIWLTERSKFSHSCQVHSGNWVSMRRDCSLKINQQKLKMKIKICFICVKYIYISNFSLCTCPGCYKPDVVPNSKHKQNQSCYSKL